MTKDERIAELNWVMDVIEAHSPAVCLDEYRSGYYCALTDLEHAIRERVFKIMAGVA